MRIKSSLATEPYRFVCSRCGSVSITKRQKGHDRMYQEKQNHHFQCNECGAKSKWCYDKKQGIEVSVKDL
jgi:predicted RNA-binding Zn-ribbon protein involved in translation (DUF1610 family)